FGPIGDAGVDRLAEFAKKSGFDLKPEMERVYKKDEEALARLFKFSLAFKSLDPNARAYGQIIYFSLLNLGEVIGVDAYVKILDRQSPKCSSACEIFFTIPCCAFRKSIVRKSRRRTAECIRPFFPKSFGSAMLTLFLRTRPNQSLEPTADRCDVHV